MSRYEDLAEQLRASPKKWLVTGVSGFIGSNLLEELLKLGQTVVGLDNFATGHRENLADVERVVGPAAWSNFTFKEGDICDFEVCKTLSSGVDYILHQAALGSVPRSVADPITSNKANVDGFLSLILAAKENQVSRLVYASSSSVYGDSPSLPKVESEIGRQLSPYAVTKYVDELYAGVFASCYGLESIGLRYFNVFGPRQDPLGGYAAVIPRWLNSLISGERCVIFGDGETSRDFCYIKNVVQANLLAATCKAPAPEQSVFNVACNSQMSLNELYRHLSERVLEVTSGCAVQEPEYKDFRIGDVRHSLADISHAADILGYSVSVSAVEGLKATADWYINHNKVA